MHQLQTLTVFELCRQFVEEAVCPNVTTLMIHRHTKFLKHYSRLKVTAHPKMESISLSPKNQALRMIPKMTRISHRKARQEQEPQNENLISMMNQ
ncbi:unnamed protein product [Oikopleura dioica]|uniref:Uncharacterized protein n=1 Tax=Oikopleura dioica TaxID=34765 RepID=E4XZR8_OIKDI|nr:unnamed protein product [Oikopleura dioica]